MFTGQLEVAIVHGVEGARSHQARRKETGHVKQEICHSERALLFLWGIFTSHSGGQAVFFGSAIRISRTKSFDLRKHSS